MIRSMTGFGRAEAAGDQHLVTVEVRSVNHRHLDLAVRLPASLAGLEADARRRVQARLERGRVEVAVVVAPAGGRPVPEVRVDRELARRYAAEARVLAEQLGLDDRPPLGWLLERPGVVQLEEARPADPAALAPLVTEALDRALDELLARRAAEGAALASDLRALRAELLAGLPVMAARVPAAAARREERLRERLRALLADTPVDETRIATEVAVWAQKTDVSEELARLRVHLDEVAALLDKGGPVGRPLDFLIQELNRELNTLGAKADDLELSQAVLAARGLLEKMREQVQNLE